MIDVSNDYIYIEIYSTVYSYITADVYLYSLSYCRFFFLFPKFYIKYN